MKEEYINNMIKEWGKYIIYPSDYDTNWDYELKNFVPKKDPKEEEIADAKIKSNILNIRTAIEKFLEDNHYKCNVEGIPLFNYSEDKKVIINRLWFLANRKKAFIHYFDDVLKYDKWLVEYLQEFCIANDITDLYFQNGVDHLTYDKISNYKLPL